MKRSAGVTAAAVVAMLGSICVATLGLLGFYAIRLQPLEGHQSGPPPAQPPFSLITVLTLGVSFGALGLATAIGLLRLQNWARISTLVFSGFVTAYAFLFIPLLWLASLQEIPGIDASSSFTIRLTVGIFLCVLVGIVVWWLVLFSRSSVAEQFLGARVQVERPAGITVIAWLFIVFSLLNLLFILRTKSPWDTPTPFFLVAISGVAARIYYSFDLPMSFLAGAGLLWNKVWGFWLAVALDGFFLLRFGVFLVFFSNGSERWQKFVALSLASRPPGIFSGAHSFFLYWFYVLGLVTGVFFVSVLLAGKKRYFAVATRQDSRMSATS
jgi:hypothetical protein